jgi:hypothetical protein
MDEKTKQIAIRLLIFAVLILVVVAALYYLVSPYQNCMRDIPNKTVCFIQSTW